MATPVTLTQVSVLRGHDGGVVSLDYRPPAAAAPATSRAAATARVIASGDQSGAVILWNIMTRRPLLAFRHALAAAAAGVAQQQGALLAVAFLGPDLLLTQGRDQRARLWDAAAMIAAAKAGGAAGAEAPHFLEDARQWLIAELPVPQFGFCNVVARLTPPALDDAAAAVTVVIPDDGDRKLFQHTLRIVQGGDGDAVGWRLADGAAKAAAPAVAVVDSGGAKLGLAMCMEVLPDAAGPTGDGAAAANRISVAVGFESGHIAVVVLAGGAAKSATTRVVVRAFSEPAVAITAAALRGVSSSPGWNVIAASADGKLQSYALPLDDCVVKGNEGDTRQQWELGVPQGVGGMCVRPSDGRLLVVGGWEGALRLLDARTGKVVATAPHGGAMTAVRIEGGAAAVTRIAAGCADRTIALWETNVGLVA
jgi:hypothetical protein